MSLSPADLEALRLTLELASITTAILLALGTPLAFWLSTGGGPARQLVSAVTSLPLVLPPTVLGFYFLLFLGPNGPLGGLLRALNAPPLVFSFPGLVVGSLIYSLPFAIQPLQNTFAAIRPELLEVAASLRASPLSRFRRVILPLSCPGYFTAGVLCFAHTIGEFGLVLMIGGNIPGSTRLVSVAIYDHVEGLDYERAGDLSLTLLGISFVLILLAQSYRRYCFPFIGGGRSPS